MMLNRIEKSFNKALQTAVSKKKFYFTAPCVVLCGVFFVFCQTIALTCGPWMQLFLMFFPFFLAFGVLLVVGVVLSKSYASEIQNKEHSFKKIVYQSYQMLLNISYLALPFIIAYMCLWIVLGVFFLLKSIPILGNIIGPLLAFIPFLIMLIVILLVLSCLFFLFFATPSAALKTGLKMELFKSTIAKLKKSFFSDFISLCAGLLPFAVSFLLLNFAKLLVSRTFLLPKSEVVFAFESFFVMIPFCILITPSVVFFFNFSAECFLLDDQEIQ